MQHKHKWERTWSSCKSWLAGWSHIIFVELNLLALYCKLSYIKPVSMFIPKHLSWIKQSTLRAYEAYMWPDLQKPAWFAPSDKAYFSWPINRYINELTIHMYALPMIHWSAFLEAVFLGLSDMLKCSGDLQITVVWMHKYPPSWKSPHEWPEGLAIKLATVCDI